MDAYTKYRWFFTSTDKLVIGGKSAEQNDSLMKEITRSGKEYVVMHTSEPGSPFCVIFAEGKKISKSDLQETAVFTACFSHAWKYMKKKIVVDMFRSVQLFKERGMKTGTWGVSGLVRRATVELKLVLTKQKNLYRSVPLPTVKKKDVLLTIAAGKVNKEKMVDKILELLKEDKNKRDELLSALPAGGVKIC